MSDAVQGTQEWLDARVGKITASRLGDVMAMTKSGYAAARKNYAAELVVERLTGASSERGFVSREMQWGIDTEPEARSEYELRYDVSVEQVGLIDHPTIERAGGSPDGLIGTDGAVEIKCPNTATHIETIRTGKVTDRYWKQIQWILDCTGRLWCDYVSYDPRVRIPGLVMHVIRVHRDDAFLKTAREEVLKLDAEVEQIVAELKEIADGQYTG